MNGRWVNPHKPLPLLSVYSLPFMSVLSCWSATLRRGLLARPIAVVAAEAVAAVAVFGSVMAKSAGKVMAVAVAAAAVVEAER